ncbi:MAG: FeoA family protein [Nitrososphaerota archaeon]
MVSLLELKNGQKGVVVLLEGDEKVIRRLSELGIVPDTVVEVINSIPFGGPVEILVRGSKLVIGKDIAKGVLVRVESDEE